jgi:hypothetical protein
MRTASALLLLTALAACTAAKQEPAPPAGPTLADFAGTWQTRSVLEGVADTVPGTLNATGDATGWTMSLTGRPNLPLQVSMAGDSAIIQTGEYESVLRAGVMVTVRMAGVMHDGMLMGNMVATYKTGDSTQTVPGTFQATRSGQ